MSLSSDDSVVSVIAAAGLASRTASVGRSREKARDTERKTTTPNKPLSNQSAKSPVPNPSTLHQQELKRNLPTGVSSEKPLPNTENPTSLTLQTDQPKANKPNQALLQDNKTAASPDKPQPNTTEPTSSTTQTYQTETKKPNQTPLQALQHNTPSLTETEEATDPTIPARVLRRRNRSRSAGNRDQLGLISKDSSTQKADPSSSERLVRVEEQNIRLVSSESSTQETKSTEASSETSHENPLKDSSTGQDNMGNRLSSERNKGSKDQDTKKKEKEAKKNAKARKSKSPGSDRDSAVINRSSIETTDSYSSAATLVATANAAVGRRSPKKSPRSIPRSGVKLREAFSSDEESGLSAGFRTPQATTPLMKRATEHTSPSQKLLEFGKNIEREIGKFTRRSPTTEKQNHGTDKFLAVHHKRSSRDGAIETDSDSFAMFENTDQLYATAPKDYFPIDDNLSDDVFMSCIDLAANSPDIPSRSQGKNIASQASPATVKKFPASSEVKDAEPKQKMTLLQIANQGSLQAPTKSGDAQYSTHTLPTKTPEKSPSSSKRFHSESPKAAPSKAVAVADCDKMNKPDEKVKLKHSPVVPRRFVVEDTKTPRTPKSPTPTSLGQQKSNLGNAVADTKSPKSHRHNQKGSKSPSPQKRVQTKPSSPSATAPRRFPAENYSPKIQKRIQAAPGSPVIPPHKSKEGSKSPAAIRQMKSISPISPSQKRKVEAPFPLKRCDVAVASTSPPQTRKVETPFPLKRSDVVAAPTSPPQTRNVEAPFPLKPSVVVVAQTTKDPVDTISNTCSKAEEESSQIQDSPKAPKQDKMFLDGTKKKGYLRSTYDNVPDSDDSMAYFTDKNDPIFFEDNCVSEEIIATEKTPLHYKVEEPKKLGIEIMQAPTKATLKCVRVSPTHQVGAKPVTTFQTTNVTTSLSAGESKTVGGIVKELVTASKSKPTSVTTVTVTQTVVTPMIAVESHLQNKSEQSSKLQARSSEPNVLTSRSAKRCDSTEPVAVNSVASQQSIEEPESSAHVAEETEQLTKRQIRRRNKKKQLQLTGKGSLDSSDGPLSPTLPGDGAAADDPRPPEDKIICTEEAVERVASPQKSQSANTASVSEDCSNEQKSPDSKSPSVKPDNIKRDHVPPPSPSANEALGGIVEEDEDMEDFEDIFVDDKAREVLVFGESVLKRLSSLVESQGDSNELEKKFHSDFDETDDVCSELNDSKKSCLEVLDEICDMGEKFKKEHESPPVRGISEIKHEHSAKCDSEDKLSVQGSPAIQKRPSIPNELQLNSVKNNTSVLSTDHSVTEPKRDSQKLTEVIDSYGDEIITPTTVPCVDKFSRPNRSYIIPNQSNNGIQDDVKSRSSDEEFLSAERRFSSEALKIPAIEETFSELMSVKNILQEMEDKTPTSEPFMRFIGPSDLASPPSYLTGSGRRSRMSPAITERTESELDISEQMDNVSVSTDSMYADDEDDGSEMIINKTYTEETGGECQVSYTFYNTAQGYDSDEFWEKNSTAEDNVQVVEEPANQASCTFKKARTEMHEIQRHLQDLRRQMHYLEDDVQGPSLTPSMSMGSSEWRPLSE